MTSAIDATKPVTGEPTTQSVRDNFTAAKSEISYLQTPRLLRAANVAPTTEIFQPCVTNNTPQVIEFNQETFKAPSDTSVFEWDSVNNEFVFSEAGWYQSSISLQLVRKVNSGSDANWALHSQLKVPAGSFTNFAHSLRQRTLAAGTANVNVTMTVAFVSKIDVAGTRLRWMQTCTDVTRNVGVVSSAPVGVLPGAPGVVFSVHKIYTL